MPRRQFRRFRRRVRRKFKRRNLNSRIKKTIYKMSQYKTALVDQNASIGVTTSGLLVGTNGIVQGVTNGTRIGNRIRIRYQRLRATLFSNDAENIVWRLAIVRARGVTLSLANMPLTSQVSPFDYDVQEVLWEAVFHTGNMNTTDRGIIHVNKTIWVNRTTMFDDNAATPTKGQLYFFAWTNDVIVPSPFIQWTMVTSYIDI